MVAKTTHPAMATESNRKYHNKVAVGVLLLIAACNLLTSRKNSLPVNRSMIHSLQFIELGESATTISTINATGVLAQNDTTGEIGTPQQQSHEQNDNSTQESPTYSSSPSSKKMAAPPTSRNNRTNMSSVVTTAIAKSIHRRELNMTDVYRKVKMNIQLDKLGPIIDFAILGKEALESFCV